jgi:hypothetical protein
LLEECLGCGDFAIDKGDTLVYYFEYSERVRTLGRDSLFFVKFLPSVWAAFFMEKAYAF